MKRVKFMFCLVLFSLTGLLYADVNDDYLSLLDDYELLLDDYDDLITESELDVIEDEKALKEHNDLLIEYKDLKDEFAKSNGDLEDLKIKYSDLNIEFTNLNETYLEEVGFHEASKESLESAKLVLLNTRQSLKDVLSMVDNKFFTMYPQIGYLGDSISVGFGVGMRVPNLPVSFLFDVDYLPSSDQPLNIQVGVGIRF